MIEDTRVTGSRLFGRRKGRPLRVRKTSLMHDQLPQMQIDLPEPPAVFNPFALFTHKPKQLWLEIGFGGGEHMVAQAKSRPDIGVIGCEPFVNGIASALDHIDRAQVANVRIYPNDARFMLDALPDAVVDRCFVLFADPWPKSRHAERRFIGPENLPRLARALKPGALLRLASDDPTLQQWMLDVMSVQDDFAQLRVERTPPSDWIATRYEQKGITAGRVPMYLDYARK